MAKTTKGVSDILRQLYQLQLVDSKIDEIQVLKGELPIEVSDLEDEIAGLDTRIAKLNEKIADIDHEISSHNANIKESKILIERYEKQLDEVKNNREYEALTKEIEMQNLEIQLSEKKINDASSAKELKAETLNETNGKMDVKKENLSVKQVELEKIIKKTESEERKLTSSTSTLPQCSQAIMFLYKPISICSCGGIRLKQPPHASLLTVTTARPFLYLSLIRS